MTTEIQIGNHTVCIYANDADSPFGSRLYVNTRNGNPGDATLTCAKHKNPEGRNRLGAQDAGGYGMSEWSRFQSQFRETEYERNARLRKARLARWARQKCESCGVNYADPPSKLCPGCEAYQDHQR